MIFTSSTKHSEDAFDLRLCSIVAYTFHFLLLLHFLQNLENSALRVDTTQQTISCWIRDAVHCALKVARSVLKFCWCGLLKIPGIADFQSFCLDVTTRALLLVTAHIEICRVQLILALRFPFSSMRLKRFFRFVERGFSLRLGYPRLICFTGTFAISLLRY